MLGLVALGAREQVEAQADCDAVTYSDSLKAVKLNRTQPAAISLILVEESGESPIAASSMHLRKNSAPSSGRPCPATRASVRAIANRSISDEHDQSSIVLRMLRAWHATVALNTNAKAMADAFESRKSEARPSRSRCEAGAACQLPESQISLVR